MLKAINRTEIHEAILAAHTVAHTAASLFKEHHKLKDGKRYNDPEPAVSCGIPVVHGVLNNSMDFITLSKLVVGAKLETRCKKAMKETNVNELRRLINKSFIMNKDWRVDNHRVSVMSFLEHVLSFLKRYSDQVEVYFSFYENAATYTDVLGLLIISKHPTVADRLTWEINIDNLDLVSPMTIKGLFCRN